MVVWDRSNELFEKISFTFSKRTRIVLNSLREIKEEANPID